MKTVNHAVAIMITNIHAQEIVKILSHRKVRNDMTREERENAMRCLRLWIEREPYIQTYKTCLEALEQEPMRDATPEERESVDAYIKSISKPTGVDFDSLSDSQTIHHLTDKAYSELCLLAAKGREALQPSGDAVSRQAAIEAFKPRGIAEDVWQECNEYRVLSSLPSVKPQPTGHWIKCDILQEFKCSECRMCFRHKTNFCPNCGARMIKPQNIVKRKAGTPREDYEPIYNCENWIP